MTNYTECNSISTENKSYNSEHESIISDSKSLSTESESTSTEIVLMGFSAFQTLDSNCWEIYWYGNGLSMRSVD